MRISFLSVVTIVIFLSTFLSCINDKNDAIDSLMGRWQFESLSSVFKGQFSDEPYPHKCLLKRDYLEFLENDILKSVDYDSNCQADILEGKWRLEKNKLTLTGSEIPTVVYEIVALDRANLKITHYNSDYSISLNLKRL